MTEQRGQLFLLPSPISDSGLEAISPETICILHRLDYFIVEKARTARRFVAATKPSRPVSELVFEEMPADGVDEQTIHMLLQPLLEGRDIGLLSEAGLPAIADPGSRYVALAHQLGIRVIPLAGPSSIMMALMASGMEGQRFAFHGYLSAKKEELGQQIKDLERRAERDHATQIWIETPYRNRQIIETVLKQAAPNRMFCIAAGLGSKHALVLTKTIAEWRKADVPDIHKIPAVFLLG